MITLHENLAHEKNIAPIHGDKILKPYTKGRNIFLNLY